MKAKHLLLAALLCGTFQANANNAEICVSSDTLNLKPVLGGLIPPVGGGDKPTPKRTPSAVHVPLVTYDAYSLTFTTSSRTSFTYSVYDSQGEAMFSSSLSLNSGQEVSIDISDLPSGTYYLILAVAGREYEGEFTIY